MKKMYVIVYALSILSLVVAGIFIVFIPDQVPAHYNIAGEVDRFGSKYENLFLPAFIIIIGLAVGAIAKNQAKKGKRDNEKACLIAGICMVSFFNLESVYFLIKAATYSSKASTEISTLQLKKIVFIGIGVVLIVLGNIMPKARLNSFFGLRTKWSMANEQVWQKSQRFGGFASVICGVAIVACGIFLDAMAVIITVTVLTTVWVAICIIASYRIYQKSIEQESQRGD